jgi:hypothetical protein
MATYNRPGVYVNELPLAAAPVNSTAAATAAGAVIASFSQGPDTVTRVTSWYDFTSKFGGYNKAYPATFSVGSFFINGGTELYVKRILPTSAKKVSKVAIPSAPSVFAASKFSVTSNVVTLTTATHGITSNTQAITLSGFSDSTLNGTFTITGYTSNTVTFALTHANTADVPVSAGAMSVSFVPAYATFAAKHRGIDGNAVRIRLTKSRSVATDGYYDLSVFYEKGTADTIVNNVVTANGGDDILVEQFNGVVFNDPLSGDYIVNVLEFGSAYVRVLSGAVTEYNTDGTTVSPVVTYSVGSNGSTPSVDVTYALSGAADPQVPLTYADYTGDTVYNPFTSTGSFVVDNCTVFTEFEVVDRPLIFFLPDVIGKISSTSDPNTAVLGGWGLAKYVFNALVSWVEAPKTLGRHFAVIETDAGLDVNGAIDAAAAITTKSSRAAVYYPHIYIKDPLGRSGNSVRNIGPSGAVVGIYLATDTRIGPFKSPAGIDAKVADALAIERAFTSIELDALNSGYKTTGTTTSPTVVNAIRNVPGAGVVVMGARTLLQDGSANRYINMRRSLTYLEKRLNDLASFAVFENNDEKLWARLITNLGTFLNDYRNQGGLRGTTIEQSYYIKCDSENNTAASIAAGEVHVEIGVALEYPAEFVVINLSQKTAE